MIQYQIASTKDIHMSNFIQRTWEGLCGGWREEIEGKLYFISDINVYLKK